MHNLHKESVLEMQTQLLVRIAPSPWGSFQYFNMNLPQVTKHMNSNDQLPVDDQLFQEQEGNHRAPREPVSWSLLVRLVCFLKEPEALFLNSQWHCIGVLPVTARKQPQAFASQGGFSSTSMHHVPVVLNYLCNLCTYNTQALKQHCTINSASRKSSTRHKNAK